jgi:hypothetical protein
VAVHISQICEQLFINLIARNSILLMNGDAHFVRVCHIKHAVEYFAQLGAWPSNVPQRQSGP